jgi:DNA-3-methyladenine glycosylase II
VNDRDVRLFSRRILGLDISMDSALSKMKRDPNLMQIVSGVRGIRPYLAESLHEAIIKSIIQQQISYRSANVVTRRMILGLSRKQVFEGVELYAFPSPAEIATYGLDGLGEFGIGYRTEYVHRISSLVASGALDLKSLNGGSFEDVIEVLGPIRGIGEWTVKVAMIAGFGNLTVFPYGDLSIQNILGMLYNKGARMNKAQVIEKSEEWGEEGPSILYLLMSAYVLGLAEFQGKPKTHKR